MANRLGLASNTFWPITPARLSWKDAERHAARLESASSADELRAIGAEVERAVPAAAKQSAQWKSLQRTAQRKMRELEDAAPGGGGKKPPRPPSKKTGGFDGHNEPDRQSLVSAMAKKKSGQRMTQDEARAYVRSSEQSKALVVRKQESHIAVPGKRTTKSVFSTGTDIQGLVNEYAGNGDILVNYDPVTGMNQIKETVKHNGIIGTWRRTVGGVEVDISLTDRFTIHYSNEGVHLVPAMPSWRLG